MKRIKRKGARLVRPSSGSGFLYRALIYVNSKSAVRGRRALDYNMYQQLFFSFFLSLLAVAIVVVGT